MKPNQTDFGSGSIKRLIMAQAIPLTLAQTVQLLYNIVDRIYIGHLKDVGELALTGLGITFPVIVIISAFTNMYASGGATLFSISRGKGDVKEAEGILSNVFTLLTVTSVVLFGFCYLLRRPILFLFGASEQSFVYADAYLKIYLLGTPFTMYTTGLNGFINAQGFPRFGMLTTLLGAGLNILLDPLFIFGFDMGVSGAALATIISQIVSAVWVLAFLTGKKAVCKIRKNALALKWARVRHIITLGIPGFVMGSTTSLVQIVCNNQLQAYGGDLYVGILTVINSIREMVMLPVSGLTGGAQPVMGFNYGAGKNDRVKESIRFATVLGFAYICVVALVVLLFPKPLIGIFTSDANTIAVGAKMIHIYFFGIVFMSLQFAGQITFQALGFARQAVFFSMLRKVIIVVPFTLLLPAIGFGVNGVFMAEPISNVVGGIACFATMWHVVYKKL